MEDLFLVDPPAVLPDLSAGPSQRRDVPHLDHPHHEVLEEGALAADVLLDQRVGGAAVEELLVRVQDAPLLDEVLVVVVLEGARGLQVQWRQVVVAGAGGTRAA